MTRIGFAFLLLFISFLTGCVGYQAGSRSLYNPEIKTVFVPMVQADTYRSALGERLTESICKAVTLRTPYDLADSNKADSELIVQILSETQTVSAMNKYNDTRQKNLNWMIKAVWQDKRGGVLARLDPIPLSSLGISIDAQNYLVAEMGQSGVVAQQELIDKIADQVVGLMEEPW